jgi:hypothetical protein
MAELYQTRLNLNRFQVGPTRPFENPSPPDQSLTPSYPLNFLTSSLQLAKSG